MMQTQVKYTTGSYTIPADLYTPVGVFLKLRDVFQDTVLLESSDFHAADSSFSFIGFDPLCIFSLEENQAIIRTWNRSGSEKVNLNEADLFQTFQDFIHRFAESNRAVGMANGLYGYVSFDAVSYFDEFSFGPLKNEIPVLRFAFYRFVIAFNHYTDELTIYENLPEGEDSQIERIMSLIRNKQVASYPFQTDGEETKLCTDEKFLQMVAAGLKHCFRGDVFQVVLSRRFSRKFKGDDFNVYRKLRNINPSPYLFYFDYGDFRLFGSSPEAQLVVKNNIAQIHPIAGTYRRTGDDDADRSAAQRLMEDPKENAEHIMLVDLARNDLSKHCSDVSVEKFREVYFYSHVIHLVSKVTGKLKGKVNPLELLAASFPAGTLSGAPKHRAIEIITENEPHARGFYGGFAGFIGFNGEINTTITIRTFLSRENTLFFQAGAGVVASSDPQSELQEVNNKLGALRKAIEQANLSSL